MALTTNDPIADLLTRIRNANTAKHDSRFQDEDCDRKHPGGRGIYCKV